MYLWLFVASCLIFGVNAVQYAPVVNTESGRIRGLLANLTTGHVVRKYLGIPFAKAERFKPPTNATKWSGVKNMMTFGKECPQVPNTFSGKDVSEECLNLNVFVPHSSSGSSLPVMVWIHGGAYLFGSNRVYDGSYISSLGNVIAVVINYRLTVFGFLTTGKDSDLKGNYGMLDQIQALEWVKRNTASFGGDPNKVTIFGESAGGSSVSLLMLSPLTKGLFKNVIMQSGAATAKWAVAYYHEARKGAESFGKHVGCTDMDDIVECLETKSLNQIITASAKVTEILFCPVIDYGNFLPDAPSVLLEKGQFEKVNVIVGVNDDEGSVTTNALPGSSSGMNVTYGIQRDVFTTTIRNTSLQLVRNYKPLLPAAIIYRYTDWTNVSDPYRNRRMFLDMMGDTMFIAPAIQSANAFVNHSLPATYVYQLQYRADYDILGRPLPPWLRAYHAADIPFVFGFYLSLGAKFLTTKDANLSRNIIAMWTNFAKSGDPNNPESIPVSWPQYGLTNQQYIALKPTMAIEDNLRAEYVAFWNKFVPELSRSMPTAKPCDVPSDANKIITDVLVVTSLFFATLLVFESIN